MGGIIALAGKDLRLLLRDKAGFFFVFFMPMSLNIDDGHQILQVGARSGRILDWRPSDAEPV